MGWEGTKMLTNGEHDELWRNMFKNEVPTAVANLRIITNQIGYYNQYQSVKELRDLGLITEREYAKEIISYAKVTGAINENDVNELIEKLDKKYPSEA